MTANPTDGRQVQLVVPLLGLQMASSNDGPVDEPVVLMEDDPIPPPPPAPAKKKAKKKKRRDD